MKWIIIVFTIIYSLGCNKCDRFKQIDNKFENIYPELDSDNNVVLQANSKQGLSTGLLLNKSISSDEVNKKKKHCFNQTFVSLKYTDKGLGLGIAFSLDLRTTAWGEHTLKFEQKFRIGDMKTSTYMYTISQNKMTSITYAFDTSQYFISRDVKMIQKDSVVTEFGTFNNVYEFTIQDALEIDNERFIKIIYLHKTYGLLRFISIEDKQWDVEVTL